LIYYFDISFCSKTILFVKQQNNDSNLSLPICVMVMVIKFYLQREHAKKEDKPKFLFLL